MELEEMKSLWDEMSQKVEKQQLVTDKIIIEMTQHKYTNKFSKLFLYESLGTVICFIAAIFILINITKLDTWYLMTLGILCVGFLMVLPVITLRSLRGIKGMNVSQHSYKETLIRFEKSKKWVLQLQRGGLIASFAFALIILPVFQKIVNGKDYFANNFDGFPWITTGIMLIFLFFFARWGYGCYKSITRSAENVLKELDDQ